MAMMSVERTSSLMSEQFLAILPALQLQFQIAFRRFQPEQQHEALHEATADAFAAFVRLWQRGRRDVARPTPLARYAIWHWFAGRRVGMSQNTRDVSSPSAQRRHEIRMERLDGYDASRDGWSDVLIEDRRTPVPDQAAFRVDFPAWLRQLSQRNRRIALQLARGASTCDVAARFKLSRGRVSQLRRELHLSWLRFHGELAAPSVAA